jgi:GNAT superfamily N-acetyltransferase
MAISIIATAALTTASLSNPAIEVLRGQQIESQVDFIADYFIKIFADPPYNYYNEKEKWNGYVRTYAQTDKGVVCLMKKGDEILGMAMGTQLKHATDKYKAGYADHAQYLEPYFYLAEFGINRNYRNKGHGTQLFEAVEKELRSQHYAGICIWQLASGEVYEAMSFNRKMGFQENPAIFFDEFWSEKKGEEKKPHRMHCWIKNLN